MARWTAVRPVLMATSWSSPSSSIAAVAQAVATVSRLAKRPRAAWPWLGGHGRDNRAARRVGDASGWSAWRVLAS